MKLLESGVWVRVRHYLLLGSPMLASRIATALHSLPSSTTLRHLFPLCALIVDSFANMSSGIVLKMENICGNTEQREGFLWWLRRKPQLLGAAEETTHSASLCVAEKIPKCFVTVNIVAKFFLTRGAARSSSLLDPFAGALRRTSKSYSESCAAISRGFTTNSWNPAWCEPSKLRATEPRSG